MSADRLLSEYLSSEALAERRRVMGLLIVVLDESIRERMETTHPVALAMLEGFAQEFTQLRKAVREGLSEEEFREARERLAAGLPVAEEVEKY